MALPPGWSFDDVGGYGAAPPSFDRGRLKVRSGVCGAAADAHLQGYVDGDDAIKLVQLSRLGHFGVLSIEGQSLERAR